MSIAVDGSLSYTIQLQALGDPRSVSVTFSAFSPDGETNLTPAASSLALFTSNNIPPSTDGTAATLGVWAPGIRNVLNRETTNVARGHACLARMRNLPALIHPPLA